jgi:EAL domain-containing protein (putative c-di-GMP-specific phosphodiesterase class I)/CheY-like chemotaxis protein
MIIPKLVVVDDEPGITKLVSDIALQAGFEVQVFNTAPDFLAQYGGGAHLIMLDLVMPGIDGVEMIRHLAERHCAARLVIMSGFDTGVLRSAQNLAVERGLNFHSTLSKPFRFEQLFSLLRQIFQDCQKEEAAPKKILEQVHLSEEELANGIQNRELVVYYQPQLDIGTGRIHGAEALVRWQHPRHGLLPPSLFIPLAESSNLIGALTWHVLQTAVDDAVAWKRVRPGLTLSVNMSAMALKDLEMPEKILALAQSRNLDHSAIMLEVTETALMDELVKSLEILARLRMKNFHLSIDDFGTGFSSLVQLHRIPFSEIKIDLSFVMEMVRDKEALAIVETIIILGHKLGKTIVAEGVETAEALAILKDRGCDVAQGYHIARPMPGEAFLEWMKQF